MNEKSKSRLWCCGTLESGGVAVGVTNLVSIAILFLWIVQVLMELKHYFIGIIVASILTFVLIVVNVLLLCGAKSRKKSLLLPWLVTYIIIFILIIVTCSIKFKELGQLRPIAVVTLGILGYFYSVIVAFYLEILLERKSPKQEVKAVSKDLISLEEGSPLRATDDSDSQEPLEETFTDLASQRNVNSTNPFLNNDIQMLPQPEEVILVDSFQISNQVFGSQSNAATNSEQPFDVSDAFGDNSAQNATEPKTVSKEMKSPSKLNASDLLESNAPQNLTFSKSIDLQSTLAGEDQTDQPVLVENQTNGFSKNRNKKFSQSHSGLIDIDSTFSPFKHKDAKKMPKMKIFLPKDDTSSSSEDEDACASSENEEDKK